MSCQAIVLALSFSFALAGKKTDDEAAEKKCQWSGKLSWLCRLQTDDGSRPGIGLGVSLFPFGTCRNSVTPLSPAQLCEEPRPPPCTEKFFQARSRYSYQISHLFFSLVGHWRDCPLRWRAHLALSCLRHSGNDINHRHRRYAASMPEWQRGTIVASLLHCLVPGSDPPIMPEILF